MNRTRGGFLLLPVLLLCLSTVIAPATAQHAGFALADARAGLAGTWEGRLEYRDYKADQWFGIPMTVAVELIDDGATVIRKSSFDDGASGMVYITMVSMLGPDGVIEYVATFRADRPAELGSFSLRLADNSNGKARDATHWTVIAETDGEDDNRPATIRETTTRNGPELVTLKEVDYQDDETEEWLARNRAVMKKVENRVPDPRE